MKAVSWILLILGAFFALAGFLSIASDIQLGIAVTGLVTFSIAYQQLRLPLFKLIGWLSLIAGGLFLSWVWRPWPAIFSCRSLLPAWPWQQRGSAD